MCSMRGQFYVFDENMLQPAARLIGMGITLPRGKYEHGPSLESHV